MNYEINKRLSSNELHDGINNLNKQYAGKQYRHKNGGIYKVHGGTVINYENKAVWGLIYNSVDDDGMANMVVPHSRPLSEFLDGRFEVVK